MRKPAVDVLTVVLPRAVSPRSLRWRRRGRDWSPEVWATWKSAPVRWVRMWFQSSGCDVVQARHIHLPAMNMQQLIVLFKKRVDRKLKLFWAKCVQSLCLVHLFLPERKRGKALLFGKMFPHRYKRSFTPIKNDQLTQRARYWEENEGLHLERSQAGRQPGNLPSEKRRLKPLLHRAARFLKAFIIKKKNYIYKKVWPQIFLGVNQRVW